MKKVEFKVRLCADAELGSGLGGERVNDYAPRDIDGLPVLAATHVRGLMRASLLEIAAQREEEWASYFSATDGSSWPASFVERVFGKYDSRGTKSKQLLRLEDAVMTTPERAMFLDKLEDDGCLEWEPTRLVTRTAIDELGRAEESSLRTTEAISCDVEFSGLLYSDFEADSIEDVAWRLALVSISAIGGSRNRGGQCLVTIGPDYDTSPTPGALLKELDTAIRSRRFHTSPTTTTKPMSLSNETRLIELAFVADSPVCCPERPDKSNVIVSGFSIPASAVQGLLLHHLDCIDSDLTSQLFEASNFRCWPMQPICTRNDRQIQQALKHDTLEFDALPSALRVSLSHHVAKFSLSTYDSQHFLDLAFEDWRDAPDGAPLKAADGVLLTGGILEKTPLLWRASEMPHYISAHGVTNGPVERSETGTTRNLFSVDAMAPMVWRGQFSVPANVAEWIIESLNNTRHFSIGKRKSVRGAGRLWARLATENSETHRQSEFSDDVLVLQSPAPIPPSSNGSKDADQMLMEAAAAWCHFHSLPPPRNVWADIGIQFGWNNSQANPFQEAIKVFLPGSTIALSGKADPTALKLAILAGFRFDPNSVDKFRERGFGAIAAHPGKANGLYSGGSTQRKIRSAEPGLKYALDLILQLENLEFLPSSSQIRSIVSMIDDSPASLEKVQAFIKGRLQSSYKVWADWEQVQDTINQILTSSTPTIARKALKALADIAVTREPEEQ